MKWKRFTHIVVEEASNYFLHALLGQIDNIVLGVYSIARIVESLMWRRMGNDGSD